jgi:hypothetical protein
MCGTAKSTARSPSSAILATLHRQTLRHFDRGHEVFQNIWII